MMEHIVQFAIGVDDERIQKIMEESAAQQVMEEIQKFTNGTDYSGKPRRADAENLEPIFKEEISKCVKEHADEIIELVVKEVAKNMMHTKKVKETLNKIAEDIVNG